MHEEQVSRAGIIKGTPGSEDSENETLLLCPEDIKPQPPIPSQVSVENGHVKNTTNKHRGSVQGRSEKTEKEEKDRETSVPAALPLPDPHTDLKADEGFSTLTLQRSKPANMKEKVEKWRGRRSDIMFLDRNHHENPTKNNLK